MQEIVDAGTYESGDIGRKCQTDVTAHKRDDTDRKRDNGQDMEN